MKLCNSLIKNIVIAILLSTTIPSIAQMKLISSYEGEIDYAFGGGAYGLSVKVNHQWTEKPKFNLRSGVSGAYFIESNSLSTDMYDRKGVLFDPHANINSGFTLQLFKGKVQLGFDLYAGLYILKRQGKYSSDVIVFTQNKYSFQKTYFDWGSRISLAYKINEQIGLQLTVNKSFNDWSFFHGTDYSKLFYGLGIIFSPK